MDWGYLVVHTGENGKLETAYRKLITAWQAMRTSQDDAVTGYTGGLMPEPVYSDDADNLQMLLEDLLILWTPLAEG